MHQLTLTWWRRFITRTDGALRRSSDGWVYTPARLTIHELDAALRGQISLGTYAVGVDGRSRWLCLDADSPEGLDVLVEVAKGLNPQTTLFEQSRRGGHLWWFCPPTPWRQAQAMGQTLAKRNPLIEVFPKGPGRNGVRLPLTRHPRTNQVYPVVDPTTGEVRPIEELEHLQAEVLPQLSLPAPEPTLGRRYPDPAEAYEQLREEVERLTGLREYGPNRAIGRCPFHDDRRPSLSLLDGFWRCWAGCGEGGVQAFRALERDRSVQGRETT